MAQLNASRKRQLTYIAIKKRRALQDGGSTPSEGSSMLREDDTEMLREDGSNMLRED